MGGGDSKGKGMGKKHHKERGEEGPCLLLTPSHYGIYLSPGSSLPFWGGENKIILPEAQSGISSHTENTFSFLDPWPLSPISLNLLIWNGSYAWLILFSKQGNNMAIFTSKGVYLWQWELVERDQWQCENFCNQ